MAARRLGHLSSAAEYGHAVLTRFPVKRWSNHHDQMLRVSEPRGVLQLVPDVDGREIVFMNTHID
jgi:endonuclease/exonuclease/phosphatase family metal-dependent hydrolase